MSLAITILNWRGETVIISARVCTIFYNIVTVSQVPRHWTPDINTNKQI